MRKNYEEKGLEPPANFFPPDLLPGASLYLTALRALRGDRPVSIGFGAAYTSRIPFASLVSFADRYGIDDLCEFDRLADIVGKLDMHELALINKPKSGS